MNLFVRGTILSLTALLLAGCQTDGGPHKVGASAIQSVSSNSWKSGFGNEHLQHEPSAPRWASYKSEPKSAVRKPKARTIRSMARRLAPAGVNPSSLSSMVGKGRSVQIGCIPEKLRLILNTVAWHYGSRVHIQSGYRSASHNRRVGGARHSYHVKCMAADIQVRGVNKYELAKFLKSLPGRGGVGTYCNISTVHIDVGPKRNWHYGCRKRSKRRYARRAKRR